MSKINYQLRPTKHVERKIFVDVLTHLRGLGCNISDYHYMGFGAPYFVDFLLFHKQLYIKKMTSFENNTGMVGRVKFNKPYSSIELIEDDANSAVASHINDKEKYLIWLDYENSLNEEVLGTIGILAGVVPEGSVLIVTTNAHFPGVSASNREEETKRYHELFSKYIPGIKEKDIAPNTLKTLCAKAIKAAIQQGAATRHGEEFVQLFNYEYADGAEMLSFGGIIKQSSPEFLEGVKGLRYVNQTEVPRPISVPALTHKERIWLDAHRKAAKTGLTGEEIEQYFDFAQHYPTYYEIAI